MHAVALSLLIAPIFAQQEPSLPLDAMVVTGRVEMSQAEALLSAREAVTRRADADVRQRGEREIAQHRPGWLPDVVVDRALDRWLQGLDLADAYRIIDRQDQVHTHEFGDSYRTTLAVQPDPEFMDRAARRAVAALGQARDRFVLLGVGTAGFWGILAVGLGWINRLSRGYMWKRLTVIGTVVGLSVPALAVFL